MNDSGSETIIVLAPYVQKALEVLNDKDTPVKRVIVIQLGDKQVEVPEQESMIGTLLLNIPAQKNLILKSILPI